MIVRVVVAGAAALAEPAIPSSSVSASASRAATIEQFMSGPFRRESSLREPYLET